MSFVLPSWLLMFCSLPIWFPFGWIGRLKPGHPEPRGITVSSDVRQAIPTNDFTRVFLSIFGLWKTQIVLALPETTTGYVAYKIGKGVWRVRVRGGPITVKRFKLYLSRQPTAFTFLREDGTEVELTIVGMGPVGSARFADVPAF